MSEGFSKTRLSHDQNRKAVQDGVEESETMALSGILNEILIMETYWKLKEMRMVLVLC